MSMFGQLNATPVTVSVKIVPVELLASQIVPDLLADGAREPSLAKAFSDVVGQPQRERGVELLNRAVEQAGWGKAPAGRFQGVAVVNNIGSYTAQVAEVSVTNGKLRVHRVVREDRSM